LEAVLDKGQPLLVGWRAILLRARKSIFIIRLLATDYGLFLEAYIMQSGFLDKRMGLVLAVSNAGHLLPLNLKVWLMTRKFRRQMKIGFVPHNRGRFARCVALLPHNARTM
jgi:hypothetical protein